METQKAIEQHYGKQLEYASQVHQAASKLVESYLTPLVLKSNDKSHPIALLMLMRGCQSLLSARILFAAGLETDAMSVTRTIAELVIQGRRRPAWTVLGVFLPTRREARRSDSAGLQDRRGIPMRPGLIWG